MGCGSQLLFKHRSLFLTLALLVFLLALALALFLILLFLRVLLCWLLLIGHDLLLWHEPAAGWLPLKLPSA